MTESFDFDRQLEDEDAEEEFLLQQKMEELALNSESETESEKVIEIIPEVAGEKKIQNKVKSPIFFDLKNKMIFDLPKFGMSPIGL